MVPFSSSYCSATRVCAAAPMRLSTSLGMRPSAVACAAPVLDLVEHPRDPDLEELVEVRARDAQEPEPFQQRRGGVARLLEHPPVERELTQLPVDVELRAVERWLVHGACAVCPGTDAARGVEGKLGGKGSDGDSGRTGNSGASVPAVAERVLGEELLVVVLGVVERAGLAYFGGDAAVARRRSAPPGRCRAMRAPPRPGIRSRCRCRNGTACRRRCPGACPGWDRAPPRTSRGSPRSRCGPDRIRRAPPRCGRCARCTPPRTSGWGVAPAA